MAQRIDNSIFRDDSVHPYVDRQEAQVAALRSFYPKDAQPLRVISERELEITEYVDHTRVVITDTNLNEVCDWLMRPDVYLAFKPVVVVDEHSRCVLVLQ